MATLRRGLAISSDDPPSRTHEGIKKVIARLLEMYAFEKGWPLQGFGSWTIRSAPG